MLAAVGQADELSQLKYADACFKTTLTNMRRLVVCPDGRRATAGAPAAATGPNTAP